MFLYLPKQLCKWAISLVPSFWFLKHLHYCWDSSWISCWPESESSFGGQHVCGQDQESTPLCPWLWPSCWLTRQDHHACSLEDNATAPLSPPLSRSSSLEALCCRQGSINGLSLLVGQGQTHSLTTCSFFDRDRDGDWRQQWQAAELGSQVSSFTFLCPTGSSAPPSFFPIHETTF